MMKERLNKYARAVVARQVIAARFRRMLARVRQQDVSAFITPPKPVPGISLSAESDPQEVEVMSVLDALLQVLPKPKLKKARKKPKKKRRYRRKPGPKKKRGPKPKPKPKYKPKPKKRRRRMRRRFPPRPKPVTSVRVYGQCRGVLHEILITPTFEYDSIILRIEESANGTQVALGTRRIYPHYNWIFSVRMLIQDCATRIRSQLKTAHPYARVGRDASRFLLYLLEAAPPPFDDEKNPMPSKGLTK